MVAGADAGWLKQSRHKPRRPRHGQPRVGRHAAAATAAGAGAASCTAWTSAAHTRGARRHARPPERHPRAGGVPALSSVCCHAFRALIPLCSRHRRRSYHVIPSVFCLAQPRPPQLWMCYCKRTNLAKSRSVLNHCVMLPQVHALLLSGGLNAALPGVLMRSQSASAMLQNQLAPLAARQATAMLNKVSGCCLPLCRIHRP